MTGLAFSPFDNLTVGASDECWPWARNVKDTGYGVTYVDERVWAAHRLVYLTFVGDFPSEYQIDHLCGNRACCNPTHLEAVPQRVNILRGQGAPAMHARKEACPKCGGDYSLVKNGGRMTRRCKSCQRAYQQARREAMH